MANAAGSRITNIRGQLLTAARSATSGIFSLLRTRFSLISPRHHWVRGLGFFLALSSPITRMDKLSSVDSLRCSSRAIPIVVPNQGEDGRSVIYLIPCLRQIYPLLSCRPMMLRDNSEGSDFGCTYYLQGQLEAGCVLRHMKKEEGLVARHLQ